MQITRYVMLVLATVVPTAFSLKCFQCNSAEYPECGDVKANDTTSIFLKECFGLYDGKEPFCRKIVTKVLDSNDERTIRSCGWILEKNELRENVCRKRDTDFILKKTCACFTDMCNGGSHLGVINWTLPVYFMWYLLK